MFITILFFLITSSIHAMEKPKNFLPDLAGNTLTRDVITHYLQYSDWAVQAGDTLLQENEIAKNNSLIQAYPLLIKLLKLEIAPEDTVLLKAEKMFNKALKDPNIQSLHEIYKANTAEENFINFKIATLHKTADLWANKSKIQILRKQPSIENSREMILLNKDLCSLKEADKFIAMSLTALRIYYERIKLSPDYLPTNF